MTRLQGVSKYPTAKLATGLVELDPNLFHRP